MGELNVDAVDVGRAESPMQPQLSLPPKGFDSMAGKVPYIKS